MTGRYRMFEPGVDDLSGQISKRQHRRIKLLIDVKIDPDAGLRRRFDGEGDGLRFGSRRL